MTPSHTNAVLRKAINDHFAEKGSRLTNIATADKKKLNGIIEKYDIELPEPVKKVRKTTASPTSGNHPFKAGVFEYSYQADTDCFIRGKETHTKKYIITKVTKCFITVEYSHKTQKCKAMFREPLYEGDTGVWFFNHPLCRGVMRIPFSETSTHKQGDFY